MQMRPKCVLTAALSAAVATTLVCRAHSFNPSTADDTVYVGILDDAREDIWHGKTGPVERKVVMPAFEKSSSEWRTVTSFLPRHVKWTVAFDGKNLGQVESQASSDEGNADQINSDSSRAKQSLLTLTADVPTVGKPSEKFTGVSRILGPVKVHRPLVVVSKPYFKDPDGWKRTQLPDEIVQLVRQEFRRQYPHVDRCKNEEIAEHDWKFPDSALVLAATYASNKDSFLVAVSLSAGDCGWGVTTRWTLGCTNGSPSPRTAVFAELEASRNSLTPVTTTMTAVPNSFFSPPGPRTLMPTIWSTTISQKRSTLRLVTVSSRSVG